MRKVIKRGDRQEFEQYSRKSGGQAVGKCGGLGSRNKKCKGWLPHFSVGTEVLETGLLLHLVGGERISL